MFEKIINSQKKSMLEDLKGFIAIPSISENSKYYSPYGKNVTAALNYFTNLSDRLGFESKNLGYLSETSYGSGEKKLYIACHADVVGCGDGWETDPYTMCCKNGKIYGRGAIDNKGPAIAVLYALNAFKLSGIEPNITIKFLVGGAEETGMDDLPRYIKQYGLPDYGLTPDSVFPIVNTESGMFSAKVKFDTNKLQCNNKIILSSLKSGVASNCVPDYAVASLVISDEITPSVELWLKENSSTLLNYNSKKTKSGIDISVCGVNAHASVPDQGRNALIDLVNLLYSLFKQYDINNKLISVLNFIGKDNTGDSLGIGFSGPILGHSTLCIGVCDTSMGYFTIDMRLPDYGKTKIINDYFKSITKKYNMVLEVEKLCEYSNVPSESEFMTRLGLAFEHASSHKAEYLGSCGLTYSKALSGKCVAYGPVFSEEGDECGGLHAANEFISEDALINLSLIYARTIYELWCKGE